MIDENDLIFGRALQGLLFLVTQLNLSFTVKPKVLVNPNICPEVLDLLEQNLTVDYIDYDPQKSVFIEQVRRIILQSSNCPIIIFYNCVYGDSQIDLAELRNIKKDFPHVTIVLDACLLSTQNYLKFKKLDFFDAVLYSFGYSKYLDLNYGGILSLNKGLRPNIDYAQLPVAKHGFFDQCMWESYPGELKSSLSFNEVVYYQLTVDQVEHFNQRLADKERKVKILRLLSRKRLQALLHEYNDFLLHPDRFDWRLNYIIKDNVMRRRFLDFLKENGIRFSRHYEHKPQPSTIRSNAVIESIINVLDDERQIEI